MRRRDNITPIVKRIINKHDPLGFLEGGAPEDEYNIEIQGIAARLKNCKSLEDIQKLIFDVFKENFEGSAGDISSYLKIAEDIFTEIGLSKALDKPNSTV